MYQMDKRQLDDITEYIFLRDALRPADVIFIPGCNRPEAHGGSCPPVPGRVCASADPSGRFAKAAGHFQGVAEGAERYGTDFACEADFLAEVLRQNGVSEEAILREREATYTLENAEKTRELLLKKQGRLPGRAILCCKAHHAAGHIFTTPWYCRRWRSSCIRRPLTASPEKTGTAPRKGGRPSSASCPGWGSRFS